jgi:DNA repair protein SbcD/Mre11
MSLRILHTADWHLGHTLHGIERAPEHAIFLAWLLETLARERVDVLLVAGDVFDGANPPSSALEQWYRFLADAWRTLPRLQIVVVAGNHDSPARLEAVDPLLRALGRLHVVGAVRREGGAPDLDALVVPLEDAAGITAAWVAAVPFLRLADLGPGAAEDPVAAVRALYAAAVDRARARRRPGQALLATGHVYAVGGTVSELSERKLVIGKEAAIPADVFPADLAYVALGHLHLAQPVGGRDGIRYAGSVLPLSFDERTYAHGVVLADLEGDALAACRALPVPRPVALASIPEDRGPAPLEAVLAAIAALPPRGEGPGEARPLLEVKVRLDRPEPSLRATLEAAMDGKEARLVRIATALTGTGRALGDVETRPLADLEPEEVLRRKWEREHQDPLPDDLLALFHELLDSVRAEAP